MLKEKAVTLRQETYGEITVLSAAGKTAYLRVQHYSTENPCVAHGLPQGIQGLLNDRCILYAQVMLWQSPFVKATEAVVTSSAPSCVLNTDAKDGLTLAHARSEAGILAVSYDE